MPRNVSCSGYHQRKQRRSARQAFVQSWLRAFCRCAYCLRWLTAETLTIDHVVPRANGGPDRTYNWVGCCYDCNQEKGSGTWVPSVDSDMLGIRAHAGEQPGKQQKKRRKLTKRARKLLARKAAVAARKRDAHAKRRRRRM